MTSLASRFRSQAEQCRFMGSPLTGALLDGAAADLDAGGVMADVVRDVRDLPVGAVPSLRFAGALHRLVLERAAPELALHYPSVGGTAPLEDVWPAAERACRDLLPRVQELMLRTVQTNEVGRSVVLYGVLGMLPGPLRLLEVGASAGLNLRCDRFAYTAGGLVAGEGASPVRLAWDPPPVHEAPQVVERRGCDPNPLDPTTTDGRLTLTSYVWADMTERLERLRGALAVAAEVPAPVERAGALEFLSRELSVPRDDVTTVVWHSVVWQYVDADERREADALLRAVTRRGRVVHVALEPEQVGGGDYAFRVHAEARGRRVHLADCSGHGPPVAWTGARIEL